MGDGITCHAWTGEEVVALREWYASHADQPLNLELLAVRFNRSYCSIQLKASRIGIAAEPGKRARVLRDEDGLTPGERKRLPVYGHEGSEDLHAGLSGAAKARIRKYGHPRGALGMKHTDETKARMAEASRRLNASHTAEQREAMRVKRNATNIERYGTAGPSFLISENPYSRAHGGTREDLGFYVRSRWEANWARYLRWLKEQGQIADWVYEPQTFVFAGVTRGVLTYTPDFKVTELDGSYCWHEIKGWMDDKSKAKLKRMAKFYPDEKIVVIGEEEYKAIAKWKSLIPDWETTKND